MAEFMKKKTDRTFLCGCKIVHNAVESDIEYCPKHKAALELYGAAKEGLALAEQILYEHPDDAIVLTQKILIERALAKAEGVSS